ncbi:MAG: endopeptidase La [Ruminococcaceae bacterium]|nr:endopeptidase La [Oscillospiraceae bacterium]
MNELEISREGKAELIKAVALRGLTFFPNMRATFELGREFSIKTFGAAWKEKERIFLVAQRDLSPDEPTMEGLFEVGVIATVEGFKRLKNNNYQAVVFCEERARCLSCTVNDGITYCEVEPLETLKITSEEENFGIKKIWSFFDKYFSKEQLKKIDALDNAKRMNSLSDMVDYLSSCMIVKYEQKQKVLEELNPLLRVNLFIEQVLGELAMAEMEKELFSKTLASIKESERDFFLREQLRLIKEELNENHIESNHDSVEPDYFQKISEANLPENARQKLLDEARKLSKMPFGSMENSMLSAYIDTCLELPWNYAVEDKKTLEEAQKILDEEHTGMEKVKERIIEYLSVTELTQKTGSQILCFVGAPGVGKTSVARSVADALGRKYVRVSLGGIRDEAEIRGHRRTYVGAMPGRIINAIKQSGVCNPVILLDEIDKMSSDFHGDPASALLEVLDGEQNRSFRDHYVEIPFDLSRCFFIATANSVSNIPKPLLDRMELIDLESYTELEKLAIAKNHLISKQAVRHGLKKNQIKFTDDAIMKIIRSYTRESGVRNLEREIGSVCRKCAKMAVLGERKSFTVNEKTVAKLLGPETFFEEKIFEEDMVGTVNGLAWTSVGGELMRLEVLSMEGNGKIELTGSLGNVMKESAMAAISYIRKHAVEYNIDPSFYSKTDIHVHAPEGAVPKDGPSAGIAMTTAIISELSGKKVRRDIAMTGEITLTGRVLPIGGLKEKTFAAYKAGVKMVILPKANERDIEKLDKEIKDKLEFKYVSNYGEVAALAFVN